MSNKDYSHQRIMEWVGLITQALLNRTPDAIKVRQHKSNLLLHISFEQQEGDEGTPFCDLVIKNCRNYSLTPATTIHFSNFEHEWPPYKVMRELDSPQLVGLDGGKLNGR